MELEWNIFYEEGVFFLFSIEKVVYCKKQWIIWKFIIWIKHREMS